MSNLRFKIGNEITGGRSRHLDLRQVRQVKLKTVIKPAKHVIRRATIPPIQINLKPVRVTKVPKQTFLDGFAYELLFITITAYVATVTSFRDWVFLVYLLASLALRVSSQRIFRSALFCLVFIPVLLTLHRDELGDTFAIFAFYFLSIGVIRAMFELKKEPTV